MRRPIVALALAVALVAAGCAGPPGGGTATPDGATPDGATPDGATPAPTDGPDADTPSTTPTSSPSRSPTPAPGVAVRGGNVSPDADAVFRRVTALTGRDVAPPTVYVRDIEQGTEGSPLQALLGVERVTLPANRSVAFTRYDGVVLLDPGDDAATVERTLAHEYVHVVQFRSGMVEPRRTYVDRLTTDFVQAWFMVVEGGAVYVTDAYVRRHMPGARLQSTAFERLYEHPPTPESRLVVARYHLGHRYVEANVDDPANLSAAYEPFPNTSEQVLHDRRPSAEPVRDLAVDPATAGPWDRFGRVDRKGELYVRVLLRTQLDRERAVAAAAGWGNDRWVLFSGREVGAEGLAWVLRWDSPGDADEFERALGAFVERRSEEVDGRFRVARPGRDTVVLFAGQPAFLANASATADGADVTVSVGEG